MIVISAFAFVLLSMSLGYIFYAACSTHSAHVETFVAALAVLVSAGLIAWGALTVHLLSFALV